jgi:hypothetical protein
MLAEAQQEQDFEETVVVARMRLAVHWRETYESLVGLGFSQGKSWVV